MNFKLHPHLIIMLCLTFVLAGCGSSFHIKNIAKTDIDMVVDAYIAQLYAYSEELTIKLYKRNPRELQKSGISIEARLEQLAYDRIRFEFDELDGKTENDALRLAFDDSFTGDRVFALMVGIRSTISAAYNNQIEFYIVDELDQQKIYNSARNLEIIAWRLSNFRHADGQLYILSNGYEGNVANLSYERIFGKMIGLQDMMAKIIADKNNRAINTVFHSIASTTLLPVGF